MNVYNIHDMLYKSRFKTICIFISSHKTNKNGFDTFHSMFFPIAYELYPQYVGIIYFIRFDASTRLICHPSYK